MLHPILTFQYTAFEKIFLCSSQSVEWILVGRKTQTEFLTTIALKGHCSLPWFLVKCFSESDMEVSNSFSKVLDNFRKSQTGLGSFKQFSEVSNSSQEFQTVLGTVKQFSEVSNNSWSSQTVLEIFKEFSEISNSSRKPQTVLGSLKQFSRVSNSSQNF